VVDYPSIATLDPSDGARLVALLKRMMRWDPNAYARVITKDDSVGFYLEPPFKVIAFFLFPATGVTPLIDNNMRVDDLLAQLLTQREPIKIPLITEFEPFGLGAKPPEGPWQQGDRGIAGDLAPKVLTAIDEFKSRMASLGANPAREVSESVANEIWERAGWAGLHLRVLHAAYLLGLLSVPMAQVTTGTCAGWKRLQSPGGTLYIRPGDSGPRLPLSVVR